MILKEEIWLLIMGMIVGWVVRSHAHKQSQSRVGAAKVLIPSAFASFVVGEVGLWTGLFFPTDWQAFLSCSFAAFLTAFWLVKPFFGKRHER